MSSQRLIHAAAAALLGSACSLAAGAQAATPYSVIYSFGDSLTDTGNDWKITLHLEPRSPPYSHGRFSNGPVWVQDLATTLGLPALKPYLNGGTDFADGGAESGANVAHELSPIDLPAQLVEFTTDIVTPRKGALFTLWIGANDLFGMLADPSLTPAQLTTGVGQVVGNVVTFIDGIALLGAKNLLVLTSPDLGKVPDITAQGASASAAASALSLQYNQQLVPAVQAAAARDGITLTVVDTFAALDEIIAAPAEYGFTDVTHACWTGDYFGRHGKVCAGTMTAQDGHLFWDSIHPTAAGHAIIASTVATALAAPGALIAAAR